MLRAHPLPHASMSWLKMECGRHMCLPVPSLVTHGDEDAAMPETGVALRQAAGVTACRTHRYHGTASAPVKTLGYSIGCVRLAA